MAMRMPDLRPEFAEDMRPGINSQQNAAGRESASHGVQARRMT